MDLVLYEYLVSEYFRVRLLWYSGLHHMKSFFIRIATLFTGAAMLSFALPVFAKPVISTVSPGTASAGIPVTLTATVSSAVSIASCHLYVDLADVGAMDVAGNIASKSFTFPYGGARIAFVFCRDTSSGMSSGANTSIWVTGATETEAPLSGSEPTPTPVPIMAPVAVVGSTSSSLRLIKLACPAEADINDPCKAVYYIDADGARHAFPNSRIFFSWYTNFDGVTEVDQAELSGHALGRNVRYRPGERLVKFMTDPKVYAVGARGELHWVETEEVATALYGADWNTKVDDISDAFHSDYAFGSAVATPTDFSPSEELNVIESIDANIR